MGDVLSFRFRVEDVMLHKKKFEEKLKFKQILLLFREPPPGGSVFSGFFSAVDEASSKVN